MLFEILRTASIEEHIRFEQTLFDVSLDAIVVINEHGTIVHWNPRATETFGYTPDEAIDQPLATLIIPESYRNKHYDGMKRYLETGEHHIIGNRVTVPALHKDGHEFLIELSIGPLYIRNKLYFASRLRDISERKAQEARQQSLIYEMNHRVKNLLAVVLAMLNMTKAATIDAFRKQIIDRVIALSSVHQEVAKSEWTGAQVDQIVQKQVSTFYQSVTATGPKVSLNPTAAQAFGIILHELFTNAVKYGALSTNGHITITWSYNNHNLAVLWMEHGQSVKAPDRKGFGLTMINAFARDFFEQLPILRWEETGLTCTFVIPRHMLV